MRLERGNKGVRLIGNLGMDIAISHQGGEGEAVMPLISFPHI
jgi:hypothetical protein